MKIPSSSWTMEDPNLIQSNVLRYCQAFTKYAYAYQQQVTFAFPQISLCSPNLILRLET